MKYCKDCKHVTAADSDPIWWRCQARMLVSEYDFLLLTGIDVRPAPYASYCAEERAEGGVCGPNGNNWEARPVLPEPSIAPPPRSRRWWELWK